MDKSAFPKSAVDYSLIYVINGDGNYLYHDKKGRGLQADEQQLEEAIAVARQAEHGEVFIFHLRPAIPLVIPQKRPPHTTGTESG